jgi:hypothetical protein
MRSLKSEISNLKSEIGRRREKLAALLAVLHS